MVITSSQSFSLILSNSVSRVIPALLTNTSILPQSETTSLITLVASSKFTASALIALAFFPKLSISSFTLFAASEDFAYVIATSAPNLASVRAIALPIPLLPPVTIQVFSSNDNAIILIDNLKFLLFYLFV